MLSAYFRQLSLGQVLGQPQDVSGSLWVTLAFPAASLLTGTGDRPFLSKPRHHVHVLVTSFLLVVRRTELYPGGRRVHRFSADCPSVLPSSFPAHLIWSLQMYTSAMYSRPEAHAPHTLAHRMKSRAWAGAESCSGFPLVIHSSHLGPDFSLMKRNDDKIGSLWEVVQVK